MNRMSHEISVCAKVLMALALFVAVPLPAGAQETQPGDACSQAGIFRQSGGVEIPGGHFLVCDGTNWTSILDYRDAGRTLFQVDYDSGACNALKDGRIRYNSGGDPPWEYCDGGATAWLPFKQPRCQDDDTGECYLDATRSNDDPDFVAGNIADGVNILGVTGTHSGGQCPLPADCPTIGTTCNDGSRFAGLFIYGASCEAVFVTDVDQSASSAWRSSGTGSESGTASLSDGHANQEWVAANKTIANYPAFNICSALDRHGHQDWYLPAKDEVQALFERQAALGSFDNNGSYWASTEYNSGAAWLLYFGGGNWNTNSKGGTGRVRCIRRTVGGTGHDAGYTLECPDATGLVGHFKFDETSGTTATDSTGTANGTLVNGPVWQPSGGKIGGALLFDEVNDHVLIPDRNYGPHYTVTFWYKPDDNSGTAFQYLYSHGNVQANNSLNIYCVEEGQGTADAGKLIAWFVDSNGDWASRASTCTEGAWHFVAARRQDWGWKQFDLFQDMGLQQFYIFSYGGSAPNPSGQIYIGGRNDLNSQRFYGGLIDDLRIYSRALSDAEINSLYVGGHACAL